MVSTSRRSVRQLAVERLYSEQLGERYVDLAVELREWGAGGALVLDVGGRWDKHLGGWVGEAAHVVRWHVQPAQYEAAHWFADWLEAFVAGKPLAGAEDVRTLLCTGGRRGGKSDFMVKALSAFAVAVPDSIVWLVSEVQEETDELKSVLDISLPLEWYRYSETNEVYQLWHGSRLMLLSGYKPTSLKRGRVDMWGMNEGEKFPRRAYTILRAPLADKRGLGIITANPPDEPKGQWVMDAHDVALAGHRGWKLFEFVNRKNVTIDWASLESMKNDPAISEEEYRREILGEFIPIGDLVFHSWSPRLWDGVLRVGNIREVPELGRATEQFTRKMLGRAFGQIVVTDFQWHPHMAATIWDVYRDEALGWLLWIVDECVVEHGSEHDLIDALEERDLKPENCAVIGDASGEWQDAERTKGRGSFDVFRARGWKHLYLPDAKAKRNPDLIATVRVVNGLMRSAEGDRRLFSVPANVHTNTALARWENRHGVPYKRSPYAHLGDTVRYFCWRFFPRKVRRGVEFKTLKSRARRSQLKGL